MLASRSSITRARHIILKIGSRALASDPRLINRLARDIAEAMSKRRRFVVVSSGAIALGFERLGYRKRPKEMSELQASAAVGQTLLMQHWSKSFQRHGLIAAQVLLTHSDLADRERLNNARQALAALLDAGTVPIINENDTVATEEIRFGDNDQLASMVCPLVSAELLLLLTDVDGVLDAEGRVMPVVNSPKEVHVAAASAGTVQVGSGGILSKVDAAFKATHSGATAVIASATRRGVLSQLLAGEEVGTCFPPHVSALRARKHWIAYTLRPSGAIVIDAGAARALKSGKNSLLPVGVLGVRGRFSAGDSVRLLDPDGSEVGRGLTRLGALEVALAAGRSSEALAAVSPHLGARPIVVHKEDLVLSE